MRIHTFQHVPFEGLGSIGPFLESAGHTLTFTPFHQSGLIPDLAAIDALIVMGGPMSVNDESEFPWLVQEKAFVRRAVEAGTPVLGICLGAQLIACALGAEIRKNPVKEIGWFPVRKVHGGRNRCFAFPDSVLAFHWHGETFDLPPRATLLASSDACANQAFQVGARAIGLQFHLETTPETARTMTAHCRGELVPAPYVQTERDILAAAPETFQAINRIMEHVLSYLLCARDAERNDTQDAPEPAHTTPGTSHPLR